MSTSIKSNPNLLYLVFIASRVVPAISVTIFLLSSSKALVRVDFPTLGLPAIVILGNPSKGSLYSVVGKSATRSSNNSPVPEPVAEETTEEPPAAEAEGTEADA